MLAGSSGLGDFVLGSALWGFRRVVQKALAVAPRGFIRRDRLVLSHLSAHLRVEWRSRALHPWDGHLSPERRAARFREQTLRDTDAAIVRVFRMIPEVDTLDVRVLEPRVAGRLIVAGTAARPDVAAARAFESPGMRLKTMGLFFSVADGGFASLE